MNLVDLFDLQEALAKRPASPEHPRKTRLVLSQTLLRRDIMHVLR